MSRLSVLDCDLFDLTDRVLDAYPELILFEDFGPYRIDKPIGKGGMGEVFVADDQMAERRVAIKFLRAVCADSHLRERFTCEIKTLAKLEHPFIARLYDVGVHPNGTPFFAMEYVEGKPLDEYCRERKCSFEERIRLFRSVCEAVQYAHIRLFVHCDLKPSNILVKEDGTPKLLDFGIAKQVENAAQPATQTQTEVRFTRGFAAPEQLRRGTVGVYTDVYALGVILYELLAGQLPYDLENCTPGEAEIIVTSEHGPEKPSRAVNRMEATKAAWNDLDVLCLKAIKNDIHRRYQSVLELTQDIDRYLRGEPLIARPDSLRYRCGKFFTRNRPVVLASSLTTTLIIALVLFFVLQLTRARNAARAETARTQRVEQFLQNLFGGEGKDADPSEDLRLATILERGVQEVQSLHRDPTIQADLYQTLGTIYRKLGKFDRADPLLRSAVERRKSSRNSNDLALADSLLALALLRIDQAQLSEADKLIQATLTIHARHPSASTAAMARGRAALARLFEERGQYEKAIVVLNQNTQLQSSSSANESDRAESLTLLADAHFYLGQYPLSDSLNRQVLLICERLYGPQHPRVAGIHVNLGHIQVQLGHYPEAEQHFRRALAIDQAWYGRDHPETARAEAYVAQALNWEGRYDESRILRQHALLVSERAYGQVHPRVALILSDLGFVASQLGRLNEAETDFRRMAEIYHSIYGERHQFTAVALCNLASVYMREKRYARAEQILRNVVQIDRQVLPPGHMNTAIALLRLGRALVRQKRYREAEEYTLAGYETIEKQASPSIEYLQGARSDLVNIYDALQQREKAAHFREELRTNKPKG
jgi:eukaryotic-like serine/threonine-protein kinase